MAGEPYTSPEANVERVAVAEQMAHGRIGSAVIAETGEPAGLHEDGRASRVGRPVSHREARRAEGRGCLMTLPRASRAALNRRDASLAGKRAETGPDPLGTAREGPGAMSRIEAEAREALLRRRRTLSTPGEPIMEQFPEGVRGELAEIDDALARIRDGRYGVCLACGGPMGLQRLRAIPEARYCLSCSGHVPG